MKEIIKVIQINENIQVKLKKKTKKDETYYIIIIINNKRKLSERNEILVLNNYYDFSNTLRLLSFIYNQDIGM